MKFFVFILSGIFVFLLFQNQASIQTPPSSITIHPTDIKAPFPASGLDLKRTWQSLGGEFVVNSLPISLQNLNPNLNTYGASVNAQGIPTFNNLFGKLVYQDQNGKEHKVSIGTGGNIYSWTREGKEFLPPHPFSFSKYVDDTFQLVLTDQSHGQIRQQTPLGCYPEGSHPMFVHQAGSYGRRDQGTHAVSCPTGLSYTGNTNNYNFYSPVLSYFFATNENALYMLSWPQQGHSPHIHETRLLIMTKIHRSSANFLKVENRVLHLDNNLPMIDVTPLTNETNPAQMSFNFLNAPWGGFRHTMQDGAPAATHSYLNDFALIQDDVVRWDFGTPANHLLPLFTDSNADNTFRGPTGDNDNETTSLGGIRVMLDQNLGNDQTGATAAGLVVADSSPRGTNRPATLRVGKAGHSSNHNNSHVVDKNFMVLSQATRLDNATPRFDHRKVLKTSYYLGIGARNNIENDLKADIFDPPKTEIAHFPKGTIPDSDVRCLDLISGEVSVGRSTTQHFCDIQYTPFYKAGLQPIYEFQNHLGHKFYSQDIYFGVTRKTATSVINIPNRRLRLIRFIGFSQSIQHFRGWACQSQRHNPNSATLNEFGLRKVIAQRIRNGVYEANVPRRNMVICKTRLGSGYY